MNILVSIFTQPKTVATRNFCIFTLILGLFKSIQVKKPNNFPFSILSIAIDHSTALCVGIHFDKHQDSDTPVYSNISNRRPLKGQNHTMFSSEWQPMVVPHEILFREHSSVPFFILLCHFLWTYCTVDKYHLANDSNCPFALLFEIYA